jgi:glucosamine--fructose-6-phosphate aminotransferase (isomerizing)
MTRGGGMAQNIHIVQGGYLADILDQPRALEETIAGLPDTLDLERLLTRTRRVVLTGMGSSLFALHPLHLRLVAHGLNAVMVETSELVHAQPALLTPSTLVVAVSQSGRSAETLRLLEMRSRGFLVLGVTNTPASPLAQAADAVILTRAGEERTVACKTYLAILAALHYLGALLCDDDPGQTRDQLQGVPAAVAAYLAGWREHLAFLAERLANVTSIFLAGRGASLAAVGSGGLVIKESTHVHSEGMTAAAVRHGPFEMLNPNLFALVFAGAPAYREMNARLARDIAASGALSGLVGPEAAEPALRLGQDSAPFQPILEALPVQMITLAIPALTGREAGTFVRATKVTAIE